MAESDSESDSGLPRSGLGLASGTGPIGRIDRGSGDRRDSQGQSSSGATEEPAMHRRSSSSSSDVAYARDCTRAVDGARGSQRGGQVSIKEKRALGCMAVVAGRQGGAAAAPATVVINITSGEQTHDSICEDGLVLQ